MTLYKLVQDVCNLGKSSPNVNFVTQGDIYQLNHNQDIDYPAFVVTQGTHTGSDYDEEQFTLTLFAVDRLVSDKSNEIDVQSWANGVLMDVIKKIEEFSIGIVLSGFKIQTFTEKFDSLCAGAYATIGVLVENMDCDCGSKSIGFVTSVNGLTGDITIKGYEGAVVSSVNGLTGDVYLNIPQKTSDLRNDVPFASEGYVNNKIKDVNTYISNNYLKKGEVPELDDYYTKTLSDLRYLKKSEVPELDDYYTKTLSDERYLKKGDVPLVPTDYVHTEDFNLYVQDLASIDAGLNTAINAKQDSLVSGINIKTINGKSILGEGNIVIQGGGGGSTVDHINVTQLEYDNLSDEEKLSDNVYFITDIKYVKYDEYMVNEAVQNNKIDNKQEQLESGVNIKTINGYNILGSGNVDIHLTGSTEHINITLEEYDNLSEDEKLSDKVFFITDIKYVKYSEYAALEERVRILESKINELLK